MRSASFTRKTVLGLWAPLRTRKQDIRTSENKADPRKQGRWIKHALTYLKARWRTFYTRGTISVEQLLAADYIGLTRRVLSIKITILETTLIHTTHLNKFYLVFQYYFYLRNTVVFTSLKWFSRFTEMVFPLH